MIDWNLPIEQWPLGLRFSDLPPAIQSLVRRNVELRRLLDEANAKLGDLEMANKRIQTLEDKLTKL